MFVDFPHKILNYLDIPSLLTILSTYLGPVALQGEAQLRERHLGSRLPRVLWTQASKPRQGICLVPEHWLVSHGAAVVPSTRWDTEDHACSQKFLLSAASDPGLHSQGPGWSRSHLNDVLLYPSMCCFWQQIVIPPTPPKCPPRAKYIMCTPASDYYLPYFALNFPFHKVDVLVLG